VVRRAAFEGPQLITRRGADAAVVLSIGEYQRFNASQPDFAQFLLGSPKWDHKTIARINDRAKDVGRVTDL